MCEEVAEVPNDDEMDHDSDNFVQQEESESAYSEEEIMLQTVVEANLADSSSSSEEKEARFVAAAAAVAPIANTRAGAALMEMEEEDWDDLDRPIELASPTVVEKHPWVERLYDGFCDFRRIDGYPLSINALRGFLRFLGLKAKYALGTITVSKSRRDHCVF